MMNRILVVGRNDKLPVLRDLRMCPNCQGTGHDYYYPINPSARPQQVTCMTCDGQGFLEKTTSRSAAPRLTAREPVARSLLSSQGGRATPCYDATAERWITPPSRATRDAAVSAEPRPSTRSMQTVSLPLADQGPASFQPDAGHIAGVIVETTTVVLGLLVFSLFAAFLLVLA